VEAKFSGSPLTFDRGGLVEELSYATRANEFAQVIDLAVARSDHPAV
jgi:hypothetical protein